MSVCFIKGFLFLKTSQNCKTLFYKIFSRSLACLLCFALLCFALKVSKTFLKSLAVKVYKTFLKSLALKVYKTFLKSLALKFYKTFYKHGSLGSTACFKMKTGAWAQPFVFKKIRETGLLK